MYAEGTEVPVERSKAEVEQLLRRAGATNFASGWDDDLGYARINCTLLGLVLRFEIRNPRKEDHERVASGTGFKTRSPLDLRKALEREERRRWRALVLIVKAKLEVVGSGQSSIEAEFLANVVLPGNETVAEKLLPEIRTAYKLGKIPSLLLGSGEK